MLVALFSCGALVSPLRAEAPADSARAQILESLRRDAQHRRLTAQQRARAERRKRLLRIFLLFGIVVPSAVLICYRLGKEVSGDRDWRGPFGDSRDNADAARRDEERRQCRERAEEAAYRARFRCGGEPANVTAGRHTLGVEQNASWREVARAYRQRAIRAHPDRGGSTAEMQRINEAHDALNYHYRVMGLQN